MHGPRTRVELSKGTQQSDKDVTKRLANLLMLGYLALDTTTKPALFALTGKARVKLADRNAVYPPAPQPLPKQAVQAPTKAMSAAEAARLERRVPPKLHLNTGRVRTPVRDSALTAPYRATEYCPSPRAGARA